MVDSPYSDKAMKAEFKRLSEERDAILAKTAPLRKKRDAILADAEVKAQKLAEEYLKIEAPLFEIDRVRNMLARSISKGKLIAKTGE